MSAVRLRRLKADHERLCDYVRRHPRLKLIQAEGDPPERYQLEMQIKSIRMVGGELQPVQSHIVEIALPLAYPRTPPQCRMLTPVFHPNIAPHAICVGDHWGAGESLQSIVTRIGEMLAYQSYNVKSPLNGEAARWVEENKERLPLDRVSLLVEDDERPAPNELTATVTTTAPASPAASATAPPAIFPPTVSLNRTTPRLADALRPPQTPPSPAGATPVVQTPPVTSTPQAPVSDDSITIVCPNCNAEYKIGANNAGRRVRCRKCQQVFAAN